MTIGVAKRVVLRGRPVVLGSHGACDVVVEGRDVGARHACAWVDGGGVVVSDLFSGGATWLDGARVVGRAEAGPEAILQVGEAPPLQLVIGALQSVRPFQLRVEQEPHLSVVVSESSGQRSLELAEGRSAELAWILGRQMVADAARGLAADRRGWVHDGDLAARLWGSHGGAADAHENSLNVCVFRLRSVLEGAGFPRRLVEKRSKRTRFSGRLVGLAS